MKTWKKLVILGLALVALLLVSTQGALAIQRITVYTNTQTFEITFTAHSQGSGWSWSIDVIEGTGELDVYDITAQAWVLERASTTDVGGSLSITDGHEYRVHTWAGHENIPGDAICTVVNATWNPNGPQGP